MKIYRVFLFFILFATNLHAETSWNDVSQLTTKYAEDIAKAENHLNSIRTFRANFIQKSDFGADAIGNVIIKKPGKIRWEYKKPEEKIISIYNKQLTFYDIELDQISYTSTEDDLLDFMSKNNISFFDKKFSITLIDKQEDRFSITLSKKYEEEYISLNLNFRTEPYSIESINIINPDGTITQLVFSNIRLNSTVKNEEFYIDPDKSKFPQSGGFSR